MANMHYLHFCLYLNSVQWVSDGGALMISWRRWDAFEYNWIELCSGMTSQFRGGYYLGNNYYIHRASLPFHSSGMYSIWRTFLPHWNEFKLDIYSSVQYIRCLPACNCTTCYFNFDINFGCVRIVSENKSTVNEVKMFETKSNGLLFFIN